jgi:transketolase
MRDTFIKRLSELCETDDDLMLLTGDLGFGVFDDYRKRFPSQFLNMGVAEQNMTAVATGLALEGHTVFTYSIGNFPTFRCLEHIRNDVCYHNANVKIVSIGGGFSYGPLGPSHHATEDLAVMRSIPDLTVVSPCDHWEVTQATEAIAKLQGACFLRLDKSSGRPSLKDGEQFELGKAREVRSGSDVTLIVTGGIMEEVQDAADALSACGVEARILSIHTLKPFDEKSVIDAALQTGGVITIEEHTICGGLGSVVAETLLDAGVMPKAFKRIALRSGFSSIVGSQKYLRKCYGLDAGSIVDATKEVLKK